MHFYGASQAEFITAEAMFWNIKIIDDPTDLSSRPMTPRAIIGVDHWGGKAE